MTGTTRGRLFAAALAAHDRGVVDLSTWRAEVLNTDAGRRAIVALGGDLDAFERDLARAWVRAGHKAHRVPAWTTEQAAAELAALTEQAWRVAHACVLDHRAAGVLRALVTESRRLGLVRVKVPILRFVELTGLSSYGVRKGLDYAADVGLVRVVDPGRGAADPRDRRAATYRLTRPWYALPLRPEVRATFDSGRHRGRAAAAAAWAPPPLPPLRHPVAREGSLCDTARLSVRPEPPGSLCDALPDSTPSTRGSSAPHPTPEGVEP